MLIPRGGRPHLWLGLGSNISGSWGAPRETIERALDELQRKGLRLVVRSRIFRTEPVGFRRQPHFLNIVAGFEGSIAPGTLLRLVKRLERAAGRRVGRLNGPRPLDIDILDFGGRRLGRPGSRRQAGLLLLPHPEIARRAFVLVPMAEVAMGWRHPRSGVGAADLLRRLPPAAAKGVLPAEHQV